MAEYIEKEAACSLLPDDYYGWRDKQRLKSVPAADVAPVRHGRWKPGDMPTYGGFKCSLCKKNTIVYKPPYCPNCGAHMMDGEA